jgi:hypothetical protein
MFLDVFAQYQDIITSYDVLQFRMVGASYQFVAKVQLNNATELHVKDYLFLDGSRKYSYHWQDIDGWCIVRWDNALIIKLSALFRFTNI